jgi:hypothetical protein
MHEREQRAAEEKKRKSEQPTVRSELEQKKYEEQQAKEAADEAAGRKEEPKSVKAKIRPLSEARAIELGANFFSEAFIFGVAVSLLVFEQWRRSTKESDRRDDVADQLEELKAEILELRSKIDPNLETLNELHEREAEAKRKKSSTSWWNPGGWVGNRTPDDASGETDVDIRKLQKEAEERVQRIAKQREDAKAAKEAATEHEKKGIVEKALEKTAAGERKAADEKGVHQLARSACVDTVNASTQGR